MILSDRDIRARATEIFPGQQLEDWQFQPASVDLTLAPDMLQLLEGQNFVFDFTTLPLIDKRLYLGCTVETLRIPKDLVGRVEGKSSLARKGLSVHLTAGFIDPGFEGQITLEFTVTDFICLKPGQPIAQICFYKLSSDCVRPYGSPGLNSKYQGQMGPTESRLK